MPNCFPAVSTAPSMTCCCQAAGITGVHPRDHWIPGNYFFGRLPGGAPRKYGPPLGLGLRRRRAPGPGST